VEEVQIRLSTSLAFAASARRVFVGKSQPEGMDPKRPVEIGDFGGRGLVRAEVGIAVGERVFEKGLTGLRHPVGEPRIVAGIDRETRADLGEWLITWTEVPHPRKDGTASAVTLDPERFEHVLLAWAYEQTKAGETTANLASFAPGDVPLDCAIPLAEHLQSAGLLLVSSDAESAIITLTAEGAAAAELAAAERGNRKRRAEELRNGIVRWLWEWDDSDASADFHEFARDPRCTFCGHFFDLNAVYREFLYLVEKGLVYESSPWWFAPRLTAAGRDCATYRGGNVQERLNPLPTNGPTVNFNGNNSGNVAIGRDVTQTTNPATAPADAVSASVPGPVENTATSTTTSGKIEVQKNTGFWAKFRAFASGMSGVITLVSTIVIAVFTVLMWMIMNR
jgi:hypothetical protein